jgi:endonuclease/exonuclease/phosphatase family metal-dependent hydrolase
MRPLRLVVLFLLTACASATPPSDVTLRVLVYNIHAGRDASGVDNLERVAALVASTNADVVLLQEVDRNTKRSGNVDQLATLIRLTKFDGFFGKSLDYQGGDYGIAVLSRRRITAHEVIPMRTDPPQPRAGGSIEPRIALVIDTSTEAGPLRLINTHFDASREDTWRAQEVEQLLQAINRTGSSPQLVGGDFNSTPDSVVHDRMLSSGMRDAWIECGTNAGLSYPANTPEKRIDYLYLGPAWRCTSAIVIDTQASDHRPVLITLRRAKNG